MPNPVVYHAKNAGHTDVKRPLYVVGAGDLGTKAAELDQELQRVFELATNWKVYIIYHSIGQMINFITLIGYRSH